MAMVLLGACHAAPAPPPDRLHIALSPASFAERLSLQQRVHVEQAGREVDFDAVLDIDSTTITLVGMMMGQRIFTLRYDGSNVTESRSAFLPKEVRAEDVLSDIQLALWPAEAVRSALPAGWSLGDDSTKRVLSQDGIPRTTITYAATPRWTGVVTLQDEQFGYRLVIRSVAADQ
jgi:hypothetical protein